MKKWYVKLFLGLISLLFIGILAVVAIPSLRERAVQRWEDLRAQIKYIVDPPQKIVFSPQDAVAQVVQQTLQAMQANASVTATASPEVEQDSQKPTSTPTITPTPLPGQALLTGIRFQSQRYMWNYCAPSNLAMALSYWGWEGDRLDVGHVVKPFDKDKNVMPYELEEYVENETELKAVVRVGGDLNVIRDFISAGYPILIEMEEVLHGEYGPGSTGWMGHYMVFNGYDDAGQILVGQDSLKGADSEMPYAEVEPAWRAFNYVYLVVYPPEDEQKVMDILGPQADEIANYQYAALKAANEVMGLTGRDQFFAYFNRGSSLVNLQDYGTAALMYDQAYAVYPTIPEEDRPYRAIWYMTGPYFAYYHTGRYWDVINLATTALDAAAEPNVEESFYWRARAEFALGDTVGAYKDAKLALKYHKGFAPALQLLAEMGME